MSWPSQFIARLALVLIAGAVVLASMAAVLLYVIGQAPEFERTSTSWSCQVEPPQVIGDNTQVYPDSLDAGVCVLDVTPTGGGIGSHSVCEIRLPEGHEEDVVVQVESGLRRDILGAKSECRIVLEDGLVLAAGDVTLGGPPSNAGE